MKISIVTDTDSSLSKEMEEKYNIRQVPITVNFDGNVFETGIDITDDTLFPMIDKYGKLPTTAAPSPGKFAEMFQKVFDEDQADAIICFVVSSEVSGTYNAALVAANDLMPEKNITVVDTKSLTLGQGYMAIIAAEAVQEGCSIEEVLERAMAIQDKSHMFGALSTLKYLAMGGRVGNLAAEMAGLLNIKPILTIQNGKLEMLEKVRTRKKAWERIATLSDEIIGDKAVKHMSIIHTDSLDYAMEFEKLIRSKIDCPEEIWITDLSAGLSVHTGPGFVGITFVTE
ncbi:MAG: DegV family protein [Anaerolineales bacterium]|nr:DegV family protein [Anaerolineales bacterium]